MKFTLKNKISELNKLAEELEKFSSENGLSESILFDINLSLDELVTNIVSYGFNDEAEHEITITINKEEKNIKITLEDEGIEFNPLDSEEPELGTAIENREIGGLGIYFVRKKMDKIDYKRVGGKNILNLEKQI